MLSKVVFITLLAVVAVAAADVESDAKPKAKAADAPVSDAEKPKTFKPHMHRRGGLRAGHVRPFPVGYDAAAYRHDVRWRNGGVALSTEQLLKRFPGVDTRTAVEVPSADGAAPAYDWETPEYAFEYAARTGEDVNGRRPRRQPRQNLPVVHYPRRVPSGGRRARTPRAERQPRRARKQQRKQRKQQKANAKAAKPAAAKAANAAAAKPAAKKSVEQRVERLEKVLTFALRQLKRNLKRSKRLEQFAAKSKRAIGLIAKTLSSDEKQQKLSAEHIALLRAAALKTEASLQNLHKRNKIVAKMTKQHKALMTTVAKELVKTQNTQNVVIDNITALRKAAHATEKGLENLDSRSKASRAALSAQAKAIVRNEKRAIETRKAQAATQFNVKALHTAAVNAQKAILNLDARQVKTTRNVKNEKKALKLAFGAIKSLANAKPKANAKPNAKAQAKAKAKAKAAKKF